MFQFSDVLYLCNNSLGLAEVRLHKRNGNVTDEQKTEQLQTQLLFFPPLANSFTFPTESARKNSSENHTKRCFSFLLERLSHGWLMQASAALGYRCTVTKACLALGESLPHELFEGHYNRVLTISN